MRIDPTASVEASRLGAYTEVGARTKLLEVEFGDYSYVVNDSDIAYASIGKFCSIAAMTRIDLGLPAGCMVGLQLPNIVESIVATLAVMRAGLVAVPLPLIWQRQDSVRALAQTDVRAMIDLGGNAGTTEMGDAIAAVAGG